MADKTTMVAGKKSGCNGGRGWLHGIASTPIPPHTGIYKLHLQAQETLGSGEIRESVRLPQGIDRNEWIASQMIGLFEEAVHLINLMEDVCDESSCPRMNAGKHVNYSWADDQNPTPQVLSAPEYMRQLAFYAESKLSDRQLFPIDGSPLPRKCIKEVVTLCRRFFRVYAHAYISHFEAFQAHGAEAHLNCYFKHFLYFVLEFGLVDKEDMQPLAELVKQFLFEDEKKYGANDGGIRLA